FTSCRGVNLVPTWPSGMAANAHQAAVNSAWNLLQILRQAAGLTKFGPINDQHVTPTSLARIRKTLAAMPPFDCQRLSAELQAESSPAARQGQAELNAGAMNEPRSDWEFEPGRFRYKASWHDLGGQRLVLLRAFVDARHMTLTHDEIRQA